MGEFFLLVELQQWRVCYQQGLPRQVFLLLRFKIGLVFGYKAFHDTVFIWLHGVVESIAPFLVALASLGLVIAPDSQIGN